MDTEQKTIEELTKRIADLEAANNKTASDLDALNREIDVRVAARVEQRIEERIEEHFKKSKLAEEERVAQLVADHLNAKGAHRPGQTTPIYR